MDHAWASHDLKSLGLDSAKDLSPSLPGVAGCPRCLWAQTLEQDPCQAGPVFAQGAGEPETQLPALTLPPPSRFLHHAVIFP